MFNTVGSGVKGGGTPGYACYGAQSTRGTIPPFRASLLPFFRPPALPGP